MRSPQRSAVLIAALVLFCAACAVPVEHAEPTRSGGDRVFLWSTPDDHYLSQLRDEFHLSEIIEGADGRLDQVERLNRWTRSRWEHDGEATPEADDAISILHEAASGKKFRCVEYGTVLAAALNSIGIRARILGLMTRDVETREYGAGHVAVEAYLDDEKKWVLVDPQWDAIPVDSGGRPLNALELAHALDRAAPELDLITSSGTSPTEYFAWIREYLFYLDVPFDNRYPRPKSFGGLQFIPEGAEPPKVFQIKYPIGDMTTTRSAEEFYAAPPP